ncbi:hypothetical protein [Yinghuangia soli]|uniref:Uncharacterized protein n=1 Tax=Yinghuangia soli TaxID=2908204 RepID=A0AA41PX16_9ACTN|nr:hypothetical protein [Yinghuangia soli]MCF2527440.1 hypothetical protein [Yinghuangia soli]
MIVMQPVLEVAADDGFALWPVVASDGFGYLALHGGMSPAEVGTAVMTLARYNDVAPEAGPSGDPRAAFLDALLTGDGALAPGGMRVVDSASGVVFLPGCCNGFEDRLAWYDVLDGSGFAGFGHGPDPTAERLGDRVRLTVDGEAANSPFIDVAPDELRRLLAGAEQDLAGFAALAHAWAVAQVPAQAARLTAALREAFALPPQD